MIGQIRTLMTTKSDEGRYPAHPVLSEPWTYEVVGIELRCPSGKPSELELSLRKDEKTVKLRFFGVSALEIQDGWPAINSGMQILDAASSGWKNRVRVSSFEQDPCIRFWAEEVKRVDA